MPQPQHWLMRENKWRVIRHGLDADLVMNAEGDNQSIREDILGWIKKIEPYAMKLGYVPQMDVLHGICAKGGSSARQRAVFARNHSLRDVTEFNMLEFKTRRPLWEKTLGDVTS